MAKTRILIEFPEDRLRRVFFETNAAIHKVMHQCGDNEEKLRIAAPKYFTEMLQRGMFGHPSETPLMLSDEKVRMFGIEVVPNYDNFIVVYHVDMPMFLENYYVVVDLR